MTDQAQQTPGAPAPGSVEPIKHHDDTPPPKTFKEFIAGIFWRDIDVCAGGGKELRINVLSFILIIITLVVALVILGRVGVIDDFVDMRKASHERR